MGTIYTNPTVSFRVKPQAESRNLFCGIGIRFLDCANAPLEMTKQEVLTLVGSADRRQHHL